MAAITWLGYKVGWFSFGSDLDESMWGAGLAFVAVAVTAVGRDAGAPRRSRVEELQGLVYGMANVDEYAARRVHKWWESPKLLGFTTLARRRHPDHHLLVAHVRDRRQPAKARVAQAANLFDLRRIIGGVFVVYGLLLTVLGLFDSQEEIDKAAGVNINLWAGPGHARLRPPHDRLGAHAAAGGGAGRGRGPGAAAPPVGVDAAALGSHQRGGRPGIDDERPAGPDDARPAVAPAPRRRSRRRPSARPPRPRP